MKVDALTIKLWINILAYQLCWWLLVCFGVDALSIIAVIFTIGFYLVTESGRWAKWVMLLVVTLIGIGCDSALAYLGIYGSHWQDQGIAPWLCLLWPVFATLLNVSLKWFQNHLVIASICGAIGGPSSYWAGAKLANIAQLSLSTLLILALVWLVLTPILLSLCRFLFRFETIANKEGG